MKARTGASGGDEYHSGGRSSGFGDDSYGSGGRSGGLTVCLLTFLHNCAFDFFALPLQEANIRLIWGRALSLYVSVPHSDQYIQLTNSI